MIGCLRETLIFNNEQVRFSRQEKDTCDKIINLAKKQRKAVIVSERARKTENPSKKPRN